MSAYSDTDFRREQGYRLSDFPNEPSVQIERPEGAVSYQPSSVDLHLDDEMLVMRGQKRPVFVDERETYPDYRYKKPNHDGYLPIHPDDFALGVTEERVSLDDEVVAFLWGRSSVGRLGIRVHNAGLVDPGFDGQLVLELRNETPNTICLKPGTRICQLTVHELSEPASVDYEGKTDEKYQSQSGVVESRLWEDFADFEEGESEQ